MHKRLRSTLPALTALIVAVLPLSRSAVAQADTWGGGWHDGWGWGHMFFGSFMMLLFWGGVLILIVLAVRWMGAGSSRGIGGPGLENRALEILEERYARGEIDKEEFEERRRLLSK